VRMKSGDLEEHWPIIVRTELKEGGFMDVLTKFRAR
jgi:hypothetical protein